MRVGFTNPTGSSAADKLARFQPVVVKPVVGDIVRYLGNSCEVCEIEYPGTEDETLRVSLETSPGYYERLFFHVSQIESHPQFGWVVKNRVF